MTTSISSLFKAGLLRTFDFVVTQLKYLTPNTTGKFRPPFIHLQDWRRYLYINLACLFGCLFVCLFVSNKRQNGRTDRAQIFCGTSRDSREGLWIIKISNIWLHQNSIVIKFLKILKIHEIFCENPRIIFILLRCTQREHVHN